VLNRVRLLCIVQLLEKFVEEYYDQNPISQLGLITIHNKRAEKVSEMSGWFPVLLDNMVAKFHPLLVLGICCYITK